MNLLEMLGLNRNDILDAYRLGERGVAALEAIAKALTAIELTIRDRGVEIATSGDYGIRVSIDR